MIMISDIIETSAKKLAIQSPDVITKAHEIHSLMSNLITQIPQEGQRCIPYIALDFACTMCHHIEISRHNYAKSAIVPMSVYMRYFEAYLDVMESRGNIVITLEYISKYASLSRHLSVCERILASVQSHSSTTGLDRRTYIAITAFLASNCLSKPFDFDYFCNIAACTTNKSAAGYLKAARVKCKELLKGLKKESSELKMIPLSTNKNSDIINQTQHLQTSMLDEFQKGTLAFCGLNRIYSSST